MTPVTMAKYEYDPQDPSAVRRKQLLDSEEGSGNSGIAVSSFFPITRYYDAADKVLGAFEEAYKNNDLDSAFVFGKRYCIFVVEGIPTHNYYQSNKFANLRRKHTNDAQVVLKFLEEIKAKMDVEEREKHKVKMERARQEALRQEEERKRREAAKYQELMRRAEMQKKTKQPTGTNGGDVQESAMNKLQMLMKQSSASSVGPPAAPPAPANDTSNNNKRPSGRYFLSDTDEDEEEGLPPPPYGKIEAGKPMPPPILPPKENNSHHTSNGSLPPAMSPPGAGEAPPPYDFATNPNRRNPFLGPSNAPYVLPPPVQTWGEPRPPGYNALPDPPTKRYPSQSSGSRPHQEAPARKKKIPVRHLRERARRQYNELLDEGRIEIRPVDTYQGRYSQSTNGCTVISPLVVAHHLATSSGVVLPDREIKHVIDNECGPLLREIRSKLGLEGHSLIIPSDVHDHLVDKHILKQEYFVGATGGNIISDEHMGEFIKLFQDKRKAGAALFFREHVVSIIKIPVASGKAYYDLVDSMPGTKDARGNPCASRTRCKDEEALDVLLTWYATKKFSESNCSYIDNNNWNEMMADLDPRVFQAFVWGKDE